MKFKLMCSHLELKGNTPHTVTDDSVFREGSVGDHPVMSHSQRELILQQLSTLIFDTGYVSTKRLQYSGQLTDLLKVKACCTVR